MARPAPSKPGNPSVTAEPTVTQYIAELHNAPPPGRVFVGMVKPSEDGDKDALSFAYMGDCSNWIKIPDSAIAAIEDLPDVVCQGVPYDAARITLKAPQSGEGQAFADLANLHRTKLISAQMALAQQSSPVQSMVASPVSGCPDGYTQYFDDLGRPYCRKDVLS